MEDDIYNRWQNESINLAEDDIYVRLETQQKAEQCDAFCIYEALQRTCRRKVR